MNEILDAAFTLPTSIFSVLLGFLGLYWLIVLVGALDIEFLDSLFDGLEGLFGGGADAALEGAADGVADGVADALADGADHEGCLGLGGVPMTIVLTFFSVFGWAFSYFGMTALVPSIPALATGGLVALLVVGGGAVFLALGTTVLAAQPLKKMFRLAPVTQRGDLVGRTCKVTTLEVNQDFGQAEVTDKEGAAILIQARSKDADNQLTRGSKALIFEYDQMREVFFITAYDEALSEFSRSETDS